MTRRAHTRGYGLNNGGGGPGEVGGTKEAREEILTMADKLAASAGLQVIGGEKNLERAEKDLMWVCERIAKVRDGIRERLVGHVEASAHVVMKSSLEKYLQTFVNGAMADVLRKWDEEMNHQVTRLIRARVEELVPEMLERAAHEVLDLELADIKARIGGKR